MEQTRHKGRWFKLAEAAQQLGVSEITVRRKAKSGQLKAILRNGRYMVYLEENDELGMFTGALDIAVTPAGASAPPPAMPILSHKNEVAGQAAQATIGQDDIIQSLKRTVEDQQTLISSLEASISRLTQKLAGGQHSNR